MRWINYITTGLSLLMATGALLFLPAPASWIVAAIFAGIAAYAATAKGGKIAKSKFIVRLKGFAWTREDFCRGWLITGDTGSGKTRSGINQLLFQVFQNDPNWGGLCIDDKGVYWETLVEMAAKFNRQDDLILLQVRPDNPPEKWKPAYTFNLLSDRTIPPSTYAKFVVDTVTSLGQRAEQSFFKSQAQTHIGLALELLTRLGMEATLFNVRDFLLDDNTMNEVLGEMKTDYPTDRDKALIKHFNERYRGHPRTHGPHRHQHRPGFETAHARAVHHARHHGAADHGHVRPAAALVVAERFEGAGAALNYSGGKIFLPQKINSRFTPAG